MNISTQRDSYHLAGAIYTSKRSLVTAVQKELSQYKIGEEFTSPLLSDLVSKHHLHCSRLGYKPVQFRKIPLPEYPSSSTYELQGYFVAIGWHDVSWRKCIYHPTYHDEVKQFLREHVHQSLQSQKKAKCERCGSTKQLEVDHMEPTFNEIYIMARANFLPEEVASWAYHDWLNNTRFSLPEEHPVVQLFDRIHSNSRIQTLCTRCHIWKTRQERRQS